MRLTAEPKPRPTCPCRWCGKPTTYMGTRECDPCHSARRVAPEVLHRIAWWVVLLPFLIPAAVVIALTLFVLLVKLEEIE